MLATLQSQRQPPHTSRALQPGNTGADNSFMSYTDGGQSDSDTSSIAGGMSDAAFESLSALNAGRPHLRTA